MSDGLDDSEGREWWEYYETTLKSLSSSSEPNYDNISKFMKSIGIRTKRMSAFVEIVSQNIGISLGDAFDYVGKNLTYAEGISIQTEEPTPELIRGLFKKLDFWGKKNLF